MHFLGQIVYPRFSEWERHAIETRSGIIFAPYDFFIAYDRDVTRPSKTRAYFSWLEAIGFEEKILRPNGWRLPIAGELEWVAEENDAHEFVLKRLNLGLNGYIPKEKMTDYRNGFSDVSMRLVSDIATRGYYWSSTSSTGSTALALSFGESVLAKDMPEVDEKGSEKGFGYSIRCVKDI